MSNFLPPNYEAPKTSSNWMKFEDGTNTFRVLGGAIVGMELWLDKKPVRRPMSTPFTRDELERADVGKDGKPQRPKHFWMFPVYNIGAQLVQVLEITQKSVQEAIQALVEDPDWGDPTQYDIVAKRSGKDLETTYQVQPKPAKPLTPEQLTAWKDVQKSGFDITNIWRDESPFSTDAANVSMEDLNEVFPPAE